MASAMWLSALEEDNAPNNRNLTTWRAQNGNIYVCMYFTDRCVHFSLIKIFKDVLAYTIPF
jgi:hypothetical protein